MWKSLKTVSLSESEHNIPKYLAMQQTSKSEVIHFSKTVWRSRSEKIKSILKLKKPFGEEAKCLQEPIQTLDNCRTAFITGDFNIDVHNETQRC